MISRTVIVWLTGALTLPLQSVALQVLLIEYTPAQAVLVVVSTNAMLGFGSHASAAVGGVNTGVAGQLIVCGPP